MVEVLECDVAIIGAGTAGLSAERRARRAGARTLVIDPAFAGTTCATVGCMPSKLLIAAAHAAHTVRVSAVFGIHAQMRIDGPAVLTRLRKERDGFAQATRDEIARLPHGVTVKGTAHFVAEDRLELDDGRQIKARAIVIATGARPFIPDEFGAIGKLVLTNETIFDLADLPKTLAVIGAGPLGLELAQAMARLGVAVTLLDEGDRIAALDDNDIAGELKKVFGRELDIYLGVKVTAETVDGKARLRWTGTSEGMVDVDKVLVAAGRPPALKHLALGIAGLALDKHGTPLFDRATLQCGTSPIFIAGDADTDRPVLHEASNEGAIAGANAAAYPDIREAPRGPAFSIMFTDPPLAVVGTTETQGHVVGRADYRDQGRARVEAQAEGVVHLRAEPGKGRLVGATLFCPGADHLGHLLAWSIRSGATADELLDRPFYHPTFEEGFKPALRSICDQIGVRPPNISDEGAPAGA